MMSEVKVVDFNNKLLESKSKSYKLKLIKELDGWFKYHNDV